jgi:hypothetical protein
MDAATLALCFTTPLAAASFITTGLLFADKRRRHARRREEMYRIGFLGDDVTVTDVCDAADLYERTVKSEEKRGSGDWSRPYALAAVIAYARETKPKEAE